MSGTEIPERHIYGDQLGYVLHHLLNPEPTPGPPYTHTLAPPQQPVFSWSGKLIYQPPPPRSFTLSVRDA